MKFQIILMVATLVFSQAQAQKLNGTAEDLAKLKASLVNADQKIQEWEKYAEERRQKVKEIQARVAKATENYNAEDVKTSAVCVPGKLWGANCTSGEKIPVPKTIADAKTAADKEAEGLAQLNKEIENAETQKTGWAAFKKSSDSDLKALSTEERNQRTKLDMMAGDLRADVTALKLNMLETSAMIDKINSVYDKTVLAAYMQDKMARLLTSEAMCQTQEMCKSGKKDVKKIQELIQKEVFTSQKAEAVAPKAAGAKGTK